MISGAVLRKAADNRVLQACTFCDILLYIYQDFGLVPFFCKITHHFIFFHLATIFYEMCLDLVGGAEVPDVEKFNNHFQEP